MYCGRCPICGNMNLEQINDGLVYSKCHLCGWESKKHKITYSANTWVETDYITIQGEN